MTRPRILVTSAGGKTGLPTALQLLERGYPVRAFLRRRDRRATILKDAGAEVYIGNQYSLADMRAAMRDVQRAYHCAPTAANGLHFGTVFAIAAAENRVEHVVSLGQWLAHPDHPSMATREVWMNDEVLTLLPETTLTINNVGWFADNYFMVLEPAVQLGVLPMPLGDGSLPKDAPPSSEDIAAVSVGALTDPGSHAGKTYRPTGPDVLSPNDIAAAIGAASGRTVRYRNISERLFLKALRALKPPMYSEAVLTQLRYYVQDYQRGAFAVGGPSDAVRVVGGREPEAFSSIARRTVTSRPEGARSVMAGIRALANFARILLTPAPDAPSIERRRDHVLLDAPRFSQESEIWRDSHRGVAASPPAPSPQQAA